MTYTTEQARKMRHDYESGMTLHQVGRKWYCDPSTARNYIAKAGGTMRRANTYRCNVPMFVNDWNAGKPVKKIAALYGYRNSNSVWQVCKRLRQDGWRLERRNQGKRKPMIRSEQVFADGVRESEGTK